LAALQELSESDEEDENEMDDKKKEGDHVVGSESCETLKRKKHYKPRLPSTQRNKKFKMAGNFCFDLGI
jgi:hypothetical protein